MQNINMNLLKIGTLESEKLEKIYELLENNTEIIEVLTIAKDRVDFLSNEDVKELLEFISEEYEVELEHISFCVPLENSELARYKDGKQIEIINAIYSSKAEKKLMSNCEDAKYFYNELKKYIEKYGETKYIEIKKGDLVEINEFLCDDEYVLEFLEENQGPYEVVNVEYKVNGIWIKECDCRIELDWVKVVEN